MVCRGIDFDRDLLMTEMDAGHGGNPAFFWLNLNGTFMYYIRNINNPTACISESDISLVHVTVNPQLSEHRLYRELSLQRAVGNDS